MGVRVGTRGNPTALEEESHNPFCFSWQVLCLAIVTVGALAPSLLLGPAAPQPAIRAAPSALDCASHTLLSGPLNASQPPYFFPSQCALREWSPAAAQRCLKGRRIFILGNSIARGFGFELLGSYYGGPIVQRADQKGECQPSCTIPLVWNDIASFAAAREGANMSVEFTWTQRLGPNLPWCNSHFEPLPQGAQGARGVRSRGTELLAPRRPADPLRGPAVPADLVRLGRSAAHWQDHCHLRDANADYREKYAAMSELDLEQATTADMQHFVEAVDKGWRGLPEHVFRVRLAPVGDYWDSGVWAHRVSWFNGLFDAAVKGKRWGTVDQYGINQGSEWDHDEGRVVVPPHYGDHLHFMGVLSRVTWEVVLGRLCPLQA
jgi:hypothetical protein